MKYELILTYKTVSILCHLAIPGVMWMLCWHMPFGKVLPTGIPRQIQQVSVWNKESQMAAKLPDGMFGIVW